MAEVRHAIEALTDPELRGAGPGESGFVPMHGSKVLGRLQALGPTQEEAHALVREALAEIGGVDRSHWMASKSVGAGRLMARQQWVPDYWVPESSLRKDG